MRIVLLSLAILFTISLSAQDRVGINEIQLTTKLGDQPAFEFFIPDSDASAVLNGWNKFHKSFKAKPKQDKNQRNYYFTDDAIIEELSENSIDIYARIYEAGGGVRFACAFDLGGVFISSKKTASKFSQTKLLLNKFYAQMAMDAIVEGITNELAALEAIKLEYEAISREIANFETDVKTYTITISENEAEESIIQKQLDTKSEELLSHQSQLSRIQKQLKTIDKASIVAELISYNDDLKKTNLETTKVEKDIQRKEAEIASLEAEINILKNELEVKNEYSAGLQAKVTEIENYLEEVGIDDKEENMRLLEQNISEIETVQGELNVRKSTYRNSITKDTEKLDQAKKALSISMETRAILEEKISVQEATLKDLEELKATNE